jgi:hypothetical protein
LLPNLPGCDDEDLHEEKALKVCIVPLDTQVLPTLFTERAAKEQMKSSFLHIVSAKNTVVVVPF